MVWKPVSTNAIDIKKEKGKSYTGTYVGLTKIETKLGEQYVYKFTDEYEQGFGIYGFTNLNRAMSNVGEGTLTRVTYLGTMNVKTKFGMKDVHQVNVEIDSNDDPGGESH